MILGIVALWVRVLNFSRYNEYLGRFLGVVKRLLSEIVLFFVLYLVNLIVFAAIAESSFTDLDDYKGFINSFITLFYSTFGSFNFNEFENRQSPYYDSKFQTNYGISFMIAFLIINIGLFMSLFVSVITVLFQVYSKNDRIY